jgi:cytochrome c-type biogenesis protein CcmH
VEVGLREDDHGRCAGVPDLDDHALDAPGVHRSVEPAHDPDDVEVCRDQLRELDADLASGFLTTGQHDKTRRELEARLLEDTDGEEGARMAARPARRTAAAVAFLVPAGALALYMTVGTPAALDPEFLADSASAHALDKEQLAAMVERLAARLKEDPENGEGWAMLARSYKHFGLYDESARAYGNALSRLAPDAQLFADYADVLAMAQGQRLAGEPEKLIAQALQIDPRNLKALALAGSAAFENRNYAQAAKYWEQMLPLVPEGSDNARAVLANVAEAQGLAGIASSKQPAGATVAATQARVSGTVKLAPELAGKVAPGDSVLIYARAAEGSRMPLAILRKQARDLPAAFTLDDSTAMAAGSTLSQQPRVVVAARISRTASAAPQPGDLEGLSAPVRNDASGITVVINSEIR